MAQSNLLFLKKHFFWQIDHLINSLLSICTPLTQYQKPTYQSLKKKKIGRVKYTRGVAPCWGPPGAGVPVTSPLTATISALHGLDRVNTAVIFTWEHVFL